VYLKLNSLSPLKQLHLLAVMLYIVWFSTEISHAIIVGEEGKVEDEYD
jgi:hypothetical protein